MTSGPEPSEDLGTKCVFGVAGESLAKKSWDAKVQETSATSVTLAITSPADASIGEYTLSVKTNPDMTVGHSAGAFVLLFNPWCAEDWVHLADEEERQEYVMSEHGLIYRGTSDYIHELAWDFGQINSNDDRGVLQGNWSIFFWGGVSPMHWNGSVDILRKWKESDYHPVKYGQCWVFGGVMCTGVHCCGPAPVKAVHEGHTELKYDLPFVFAEVNADRVDWKIMADGSQKRIMSDTKLVGQNISTKSVGSDERLDITANYKYPEGTEKEREAFKEAVRRSEKLRKPEPAPAPPPPKISVKIEEQSKLINGTDIDLVIRLQSPTLRDVVLHVNAQIPFSKYGSHIQENKSIKVTAVANDKEHTEEVYLAEKDIVLENPPFSITVSPAHFPTEDASWTIKTLRG
ncbi:hypothetical protein ANANG_G00254130 [Anguilla anguilla]|uniref:Transglutaminase N-terminal domain-containing protein n=1 Tax=Anguilla anguilla TaxID=7936 RepID=A0A9D3LSU4_ANGAN|nr:hypothetical protein ANANG_G00254130 [Anguilla anguilla]